MSFSHRLAKRGLLDMSLLGGKIFYSLTKDFYRLLSLGLFLAFFLLLIKNLFTSSLLAPVRRYKPTDLQTLTKRAHTHTRSSRMSFIDRSVTPVLKITAWVRQFPDWVNSGESLCVTVCVYACACVCMRLYLRIHDVCVCVCVTWHVSNLSKWDVFGDSSAAVFPHIRTYFFFSSCVCVCVCVCACVRSY